jgi:dTMP kinase
MKGKFITFEGSEGSGKSTQIALLHKYLKRKGKSIVFIREPGATNIGEKIRQVLLDVKSAGMNDICETFLYMAARAQLVEEVIRPALAQGKIVLCDRFLDSTSVYQGYGNGVDLKLIESMGKAATQGVNPDITFFFDLDAGKGLSRLKRKKDRIERRSLAYHRRVRAGYQALAKKDPERIKLIAVDGSIEEIHGRVVGYIDQLLKIQNSKH